MLCTFQQPVSGSLAFIFLMQIQFAGSLFAGGQTQRLFMLLVKILTVPGVIIKIDENFLVPDTAMVKTTKLISGRVRQITANNQTEQKIKLSEDGQQHEELVKFYFYIGRRGFNLALETKWYFLIWLNVALLSQFGAR